MNQFQLLAGTNRKRFFEIRRAFQAETRQQPKELTEVEIPKETTAGMKSAPVRAWRSREFAAFEFREGDENQHVRITVNRSEIDNEGNWRDGITWDDLQRVKREIGYGDRMAVEIYPPDHDIVNVANMRHLWLIDSLPFGWKNQATCLNSKTATS